MTLTESRPSRVLRTASPHGRFLHGRKKGPERLLAALILPGKPLLFAGLLRPFRQPEVWEPAAFFLIMRSGFLLFITSICYNNLIKDA